MKLYIFLGFFLSIKLNAIPDPIKINKTEDLVFVDFKQATYELNYDLNVQKVFVSSKILLNQSVAGKVMIDLVDEPSQVLLDGREVSTKVYMSKEALSSFRYIDFLSMPGSHEVEINHELKSSLNMNSRYVSQMFFMSDLSDRSYLEKYLPTNLEFDQYSMVMKIKLSGEKEEHRIFTNGLLKQTSKTNWEILFPDYFTSSSMFFHIAPIIQHRVFQKKIKSIDGRDLPLIIYTKEKDIKLESFQVNAEKIITELEQDYGPFPHPSVLIQGVNGGGGMEYCGATVTGPGALSHELFHSYMARGVMPLHGTSGWIDEAFARWRDRSYRNMRELDFPTFKMVWDNTYTRFTNRHAYNEGENIFANLSHQLDREGLSLKSFLKNYITTNLFKQQTNQSFQFALETYFGKNLQKFFDQYIYGTTHVPKKGKPSFVQNYFHPIVDEEYEKSILE